MLMENLKFVVAKNLIKLRKNKKLTQAELAEQMNYSDKSVSKWETGETSPSIETLKELAEFYNVRIDDIVDENLQLEKIEKDNTHHKHSRTIISLLGVMCVWLIGTLCFFFSLIYDKTGSIHAWLAFVACVPISMILAIIFNSIWGPKKKINYIYISFLLWSLLTFVYLAIFCYSNYVYNLWPLFFIGIPSQIIIILWSRIKKR